MKTYLIIGFFLSALVSHGQNADSLKLRSRLNTYMDLTREKNFDKIMDYIHPSLYKIAPRIEMKQALESAYATDGIDLTFDSMAVVKISEEFLFNSSIYRRVDYFGIMRMRFTDTEKTEDSTFVNMLLPALQAEFPDQEVKFDAKTTSFIIRGEDILLAIKDTGAEWLFLGFERGNPMIESLFPKEVRERFKIK